MKKPLFVLSPCGTSMLTHKVPTELRDVLNKNANARSRGDVPAQDAEQIDERVQTVRKKLADADMKIASDMSAELNGIIKLAENRFEGRREHHLLLCTDTWMGKITAELAAEWLKSKGVSAETRAQKDLQTADMQAFQLALSEIVKWCEEEITNWRKTHHIIFNLTGGFKSVQGFLQTLAAFYADESVYVFEKSELLRIPRLPIQMDAHSVVRENLRSFRRLDLGLNVSDVSGIPEIFLLQMDGGTAFSAWGNWSGNRQKSRFTGMRCIRLPVKE